jgi:uncharacterized LabA/DUF88 family protein
LFARPFARRQGNGWRRTQGFYGGHAEFPFGYNSKHIRPLAVRPLNYPESVPNPWGIFISAARTRTREMKDHQIAILIDGGYFLKRLPHLVPADKLGSPENIVKQVRRLCFNHVKRLVGPPGRIWQQHVYRIFFYDATPYEGKAQHPLDHSHIDYAKTVVANDKRALFEELRKVRKLALRLGKVSQVSDWAITPKLTKTILKTKSALAPMQALAALANGDASDAVVLSLSATEAKQLLQVYQTWQSLKLGDISLGLRQKGVDMRIAVDIASISLKKQASTIVLVSGDSDFVPAAKLARREGMEFILDPLGQVVNDDLFEHIDGLNEGLRKPKPAVASASASPTSPPQAKAP